MDESHGSSASAPKSGTRSLVKDARFAHRTEALFRALSSDYLLREQFISDPARILADYVTDERITEDVADTANQLLYAVISSPRLASWLTSYSRQLKNTVPTRQAFAMSLAQALSTSGDELAVLALIHAASGERDHFSLQADMLRAVAVALGMFQGQGSSGTEATPGPGPGTEATPGPGPGTEVSPAGRISIGQLTRAIKAVEGVIRRFPGVFSSGTEATPGPGPGTDQTPGPGGTEVSPAGRTSIGQMTRVLQAITVVLRRNPGVFSSGTEATPGPGPGTDQTPGPGGTEVSPAGKISTLEMENALRIIQRVVRGNPGVFSSGTEATPGPGPGTDQTPGPGGTEVSPAGRISIGEMRRVLQTIEVVVRRNPGVFSSGTEATPGPGTDQTPGPGPGTNVSPGSIFHGRGLASVTLEALTRYATRLRANRALAVSGLEGR